MYGFLLLAAHLRHGCARNTMLFQLSQAAAIQGEKHSIPVMEILQGMRDILHQRRKKAKLWKQ
jgi:hypothetical protein